MRGGGARIRTRVRVLAAERLVLRAGEARRPHEALLEVAASGEALDQADTAARDKRLLLIAAECSGRYSPGW